MSGPKGKRYTLAVMAEDRRYATRHPAALHAQVETDAGRSTIALTQDVSATGLLVLSHQPLALGQGVTIYVLVDGEQHVLSGKVVRHEPLAHAEAALWRSKAAVAVDGGAAELAAILAAIT